MRLNWKRIREKKRVFVLYLYDDKDMYWANDNIDWLTKRLQNDRPLIFLKRNIIIWFFKLKEEIDWASIVWMPKYGFCHEFDIYLPR